MCSTPSGITASGTNRPARVSAPLGVLNAFRHHGERDPAAGAHLHQGLQGVLNAFRHHGERDDFQTWPDVRAVNSAQRLPASRRAGPRAPALPAREDGKVLNAFRHHGERDAGEVLVAFREKNMCSTPSGITASGTTTALALMTGGMSAQRLPASRRAGHTASPCVAGRDCAQRLPASRRAGPETPMPLSTAQETCSTPSGITASGTQMLNGLAILGPTRCSTPSGITASGTADEAIGVPLHQVLNAFRHHGERDAGIQQVMRTSRPLVLNAFRHHGERDVHKPCVWVRLI